MDDLDERVTEAILRAERLPAGSYEAEAAFREVWLLEEAIAGLTAPEDVEGEIARLGAVAAALSAAEPLQALVLVDRYLAEGVSPEATARLEGLRAEADADLARRLLTPPLVVPVRYRLPDAA